MMFSLGTAMTFGFGRENRVRYLGKLFGSSNRNPLELRWKWFSVDVRSAFLGICNTRGALGFRSSNFTGLCGNPACRDFLGGFEARGILNDNNDVSCTLMF